MFGIWSYQRKSREITTYLKKHMENSISFKIVLILKIFRIHLEYGIAFFETFPWFQFYIFDYTRKIGFVTSNFPRPYVNMFLKRVFHN